MNIENVSQCIKASMVELTMTVLSYTQDRLDQIVAEAFRILNKGGIIAYPTESFYALGVLASDDNALKKLFKLKGRPPEKPLPLIVGDTDVLLSVAQHIPDPAKNLIERFWPGPLTIVFNARKGVSPLLTGGTGNVAVRIPGDSAALSLARALRSPITATSANPSGEPPAETAHEVIDYFGARIDIIIDAGRSPGGKPSTIVDVTVAPPRILREGRVSLA
jgi:L-threonylcarbamoyladenylate synthase